MLGKVTAALLPEELPQTVTVRDAAAAVQDKEEPGEVKEGDSSTATPTPPPPPDVTVKNKVKKEDDDGGDRHDEKDQDDPNGDGPCTKMTMRLRRNLSNPQFVSGLASIHPYGPVAQTRITTNPVLRSVITGDSLSGNPAL